MARAGLTAERLAQGGADLADEIGFEYVTVAGLARRFKVKPASLYFHVKSSADLKARIALIALAELADRASEAVAGRSREAALAALGNSYRDYAHEHPGRFSAMQLRLDSGTAARSDGPRHTRLMRAILRDYELSEADQTHAVRLLGSTFQGYVSLELSGSFSHSEPSSNESWEHIIHGLHILLQNWQVRQPGASENRD